jgi:hypothetical protein
MRFSAFVLTACLVAGSARAAIYENSITVDSEEDIFEAEQRGDISSDTAETLIEIIGEGVDLNSADREELYDLPGITYADVDAILEYRKGKGRIDDPSELVGAGALTAEQLLQIAPFIRIDSARPVLPVSGKMHLASRFTTTDNVPPPAMLSARLKGPVNLSAGFMMFTTRRRADTPTYDPVNDALTSRGFLYQPHLPRVFVQWKPGNARLVVGTFTIGFAERLTLDNTRRVTPRGIYLVDDYTRAQDLTQTCKLSSSGFELDPGSGCDPTTEKNLYITPDYRWRDSFRGIAGSIENLKLGEEASLSVYGFLSYQQRPIYQYQLYDRRYCPDPRDDDSDLCKSPDVFLPDGATRLAFSTLTNAFDELTGGGHVTFKPNYRWTLGVTSYAAMPFFRQSPLELDFQEYSRYPTGGAFGAVGVDAHTSFKEFNFFLEATHNFDGRFGSGGKGGYGIEQRTTFSPRQHEFELSLRFYDDGFGTPYARPIASPDQLEGQRARNEAGARFRWSAKLSRDWQTRVTANFWVNPWPSYTGVIDPTLPPQIVSPAGVANLWVLGRVDFTGWWFFQPALWVDVRNKNLASSVHGTCASGYVLTEGDIFACGGDFYKVSLRLEGIPIRRKLSAIVQTSFTWRDDVRYKDRFRNDVQVWAEVRAQPVDFLQFRLRSRYLYQDISDNTYLEQSLWSFVEGAWIFGKGNRLALRYDLYQWLDERATTANRVPNPEHRLQLDFRAAF